MFHDTPPYLEDGATINRLIKTLRLTRRTTPTRTGKMIEPRAEMTSY